MEIIQLHRRAAERFRICLVEVGSDQWELPTPCAEWDVRALVNHVTGNHEQMALRLHGRPADRCHDGPLAAWSAACAAVQAGLSRTEVLQQQAPSPFGGQMSIADLARILTVDLTTHTWDLARATGRNDPLDPEVVNEVLPMIERIHPTLAAGGKFAPAISVPESAGAQQRLLALLGRQES
ncbi:TIGR03086 family metal-binding protein [Nocardia arizonensis]|uniref:TIGR03086 family metal-binding protein n=1 Tax=Nocardia arizonensis TaxID=1141647 RepID=UPI0006D06795|nr:TIGR03086 family metal-binding protein [Nocardia arizonensis]